ncbi:hypothetical protein AU511_03410 [Lonsdalea iberica]|uniref:Uncharacterized protein n=1 Tax=Lonsdalea iberica TaxID=1082703 RepID=A0A1X3RZI6_9GAMM|nr:hypothetical protein AU511_03410 [Lonsdalea iberica]
MWVSIGLTGLEIIAIFAKAYGVGPPYASRKGGTQDHRCTRAESHKALLLKLYEEWSVSRHATPSCGGRKGKRVKESENNDKTSSSVIAVGTRQWLHSVNTDLSMRTANLYV